jgi:hypothetical protein
MIAAPPVRKTETVEITPPERKPILNPGELTFLHKSIKYMLRAEHMVQTNRLN